LFNQSSDYPPNPFYHGIREGRSCILASATLAATISRRSSLP
jgi:hypothetical protein